MGILQRVKYAGDFFYRAVNPYKGGLGLKFLSTPFGCLTCKRFVWRGVNFVKLHANNLSENIFPIKVNCERSREQSGVGGYMKGVG